VSSTKAEIVDNRAMIESPSLDPWEKQTLPVRPRLLLTGITEIDELLAPELKGVPGTGLSGSAQQSAA